MRACLFLLLTSCLDVVEHGNPIELSLNLLDCDRSSVVTGARELRVTVNARERAPFTRVVPIDQPPHTLSIAPNTDVVVQVDALDASGRPVARGASLHFASPTDSPVAIDLHRVGQFTKSCNSLVTARAFHSATGLADGRVLVVGGIDSTGTALSSMEVVTSSEVRDVGPLALRTPGGTTRLPRARHAAVLISNGQVVISGGESGRAILSSALIVDPSVDFATGAFRPVTLPRSRHVALKAGTNVFLIGGSTRSATETVPNAAVERLDLMTNEFDTVSSVPAARLDAALGRAGPVAIIAGGVEGNTVSSTVTVLSIEPSGITRELALSTPRRNGQLVTHGDRALLVGGFDENGAPLSSTEWIIVDPPGATVVAGPAIAARGETCAVALPGERTFLLGSSPTPELLEADGTIEAVPFSGSATVGQSCLLEENGSVLIIGGLDTQGRPVDEVWRYQPPE